MSMPPWSPLHECGETGFRLGGGRRASLNWAPDDV
jgi:hypothetical protein